MQRAKGPKGQRAKGPKGQRAKGLVLQNHFVLDCFCEPLLCFSMAHFENHSLPSFQGLLDPYPVRPFFLNPVAVSKHRNFWLMRNRLVAWGTCGAEHVFLNVFLAFLGNNNNNNNNNNNTTMTTTRTTTTITIAPTTITALQGRQL